MKFVFIFLALSNLFFASAQQMQPEDYGFRHLKMPYKGQIVDILVQSKKGDEQIKKPLLLFCQGSLPQPLLKIDSQGSYPVFPFKTDSFLNNYHLAIISKPGVPVISKTDVLTSQYLYFDANGNAPKVYTDNNYLDYYVKRNLKVIKFLQRQPYVDSDSLIVAGHSEGSTVAAKLAAKTKKVTHLIYASGCPMGRIMAMVTEARAKETVTETTSYAEDQFIYWNYVVDDNDNLQNLHGDSNKATYDFSEPSIDYLQKLKIPILICYGTKDWSAPFNDFLRVEMIRQKKKNFTFKAYIGLEHNFFPVKADGQPNYEQYNWEKVASDWLQWIENY